MMDQNRVQLSLSTQKNKVSAPKAEPADHKRAVEKAGNNKSDFSAHMQEKLAAADKKAAAKNAQSEPAAEKKKTDASKSDKPVDEAASAELAQQTEQVAQVDEAAGDAQDLVLEIAKDQTDEKDSAISALMAQFITSAQEASCAKETKQEVDLEAELAAQIVMPNGNNMPVAVQLEQSTLPQNEESIEDELITPTDEELLLVTQQIGMAGTLSPQQKLSPAELAGQAVAAKTAVAEVQANAAPPTLQSLLLAKSSPDEASAPVEILDLESLQSLNELAAETPKPQDFAASLRGVLQAQPASPLANMQVTQVSAPLQIDPQQQAQAAEELNERINLMLSKNLKQVDIRLDPPELGRLQIKLSMHNDNASVQFTVSNQAAKDMLEHALPRLREMLQQQGLQLAQSSVQQESHQQQSQFSGNFARQQGHAHLDGEAQTGQDAEVAPTGHLLSISKPADGIDYYA